GQIWVGTYSEGLYVLDKKRGQTAHYPYKTGDPGAIGGNGVGDILFDRTGSVWLGTTTNGLTHLVFENRWFQNFLPDSVSERQNILNSVTTLAESRTGHIWVGTESSGLMCFDPKTRKFQPAESRYPELKSGVHPYILALCETRDGVLWITTNSGGTYRFDPGTRTLQSFRHNAADSTSIAFDYANALLEDRTGRVWVGTYRGLDRYNERTGHFEHFPMYDPGNPANEQNNYITSLYEDKSGHIWVGAMYGLSVWSPQTGAFRHFLHTDHRKGEFKSLAMHAVLQDKTNALWAGTEYGLYRLVFPDPDNPFSGEPLIRRYLEPDGLPSQGVLALSEDSRGYLWINTLRGGAVFRNPHHDKRTPPDFKVYTFEDGLQNRAFVRSACLKTLSGFLFLGGRNGFDMFHPDSIRDDGFRPPVVITALEKFDTDHPDAGAISETGIPVRKEVVLSYKNNLFSIEFAALDFRAPDKIRYAYRLLGFNDSWVQLGTQRRVTFTNLDPGTYTFEVRGTNSDGVWNDTPAVLKIVITPPWWKTTWAYLAYVLLLAGGVFGFVRMRVRYLENRTRELEKAVLHSTAQILEQKETLEKQAGELQELDRLKSRFYANITHELRTPLTLMLGPLNSVLKNWKSDPAHQSLLKIAQENGRKLLNLISEILDLGKLDAGRMTVETTPVAVQPMLARMVAQFDSHARYLGVELGYRCDLPPDRTVLLDAKKFETVVNNLLSNALKFTAQGGTVQVNLEEKPGMLLLSVQDTGRGIHPEDLPHVFDRYFQTKRTDVPVEGGTGIGLALSAELVRLCGGRIRVESTVGAGSVFWVEWPTPNPGGEGGLPSFPVGDSDVGNHGDSLQTNQSVSRDVAPLPAGGGVGGGVRILVAEDNPDLQAYLKHLLVPEYDVVVVANGEEALAWLGPTHSPSPEGEGGLPSVPVGDSGIGNQGDSLQPNHLVLRDVAPLGSNPTPIPSPEGEGGLLSVPVGDSGVGNQGDSLQTNHTVLRDVTPLGSNPTPIPSPEGEGGLLSVPVGDSGVGNQGDLLQTNHSVLRDVAPLPAGGGAGVGVDLIISDIMMPRMDGFQLLDRLKNDDRYRHIPVVMLTARADMQDKLRALRTGVDDYLTKPFDEEELLTRVRNLIQRQQLRAAIADEAPNSKLETQNSKLKTPLLSQADAGWLLELETWTRANLHHEFLTVSAMADQAALSERQLLRRMRELTGLSPQQYIGEMRLQKAREWLELGTFRTVAEAAYAAGFGNAKAFSRAYRERFGRLPSSYF
ncbi:MAG: response regulator, partial [Saprospiraceae bacterium]|nr:response regulator [Saprospiraceae bacterium]